MCKSGILPLYRISPSNNKLTCLVEYRDRDRDRDSEPRWFQIVHKQRGRKKDYSDHV